MSAGQSSKPSSYNGSLPIGNIGQQSADAQGSLNIGQNPITPWGNGQSNGGGIGPDIPPDEQGGAGNYPIDVTNLKRSSALTPAMQYLTLGKNSAGLCQLTFIDDSGKALPNETEEWGDPCFALTASHCVQNRVDATSVPGVFTANLQAPQLGEGPVKAMVHVPPAYLPYIQTQRGFSPIDYAVLEFSKDICTSAKRRGAKRVKVCDPSENSEGSHFLMSHRLNKQTLVRAGNSNTIPLGSVLDVHPHEQQDVIMQGDSGGPLVKSFGNSSFSNPSNWKCIMGVASTAPIRGPGQPASSANYAAGVLTRTSIKHTLDALKKSKTPNATVNNQNPGKNDSNTDRGSANTPVIRQFGHPKIGTL